MTSLPIKMGAEPAIAPEIGLWLFTEDSLSTAYIADWLGKDFLEFSFRSLLEPINIIWIDHRAESNEEAAENLTAFLHGNGFESRGGSSTGYWGWINGKWFRQLEETWSDRSHGYLGNNHGRVFGAQKVPTDSVNNIYISTGAFSLENALHDYVSFDEALSDFSASGEWQVLHSAIDLGNRTDNEFYTTDDHRGVLVFELK